jgi:carbamoyl-phosphate synthase small subunit
MDKAILALADGRVFEGHPLGAIGEAVGEVVFNTSMTGYQEVLTDPSYCGQIAAMTYPLIGNYGVNEEDLESARPQVRGFVVKECSHIPSSWRGSGSLDDFLQAHGIVGIQGIDTRALTRHIRGKGAQEGVISSVDLDPASLVEKARSSPGLVGRDLVKEVTCSRSYRWEGGAWKIGEGYSYNRPPSEGRLRVVAYDFGMKRNILRMLVESGCDPVVVPAHTTAEETLSMNPDGIFLSNGPGDPEGVGYAIANIVKLIDKRPIFGICLGHQLLALALGGRTYKLKFGHRGGNHPVMDLATGKVEITCQNHGFSVDADSVEKVAEITHINLNDKTVEGMKHRELPVFSVQYHPEASPGPHDSRYLFGRFTEMMTKAKE